MTRAQETAAVRRALKAAGDTGISVRHGRGTSWGFLRVEVDRRESEDYRGQFNRVRMTAEATSKRDTAYTRSQIMVILSRVEV